MDNQDTLQRKIALKSLFDSPGFAIFESELKEFIESCDIERANAFNKVCSVETANFLNGNKVGLLNVKYIIEGFREELIEIADGR